MTALNFEPVNEPMADAPDLDDLTCRCPAPDDQYLLEIDASSVFLTHKACGKPVDDWAADALQLPPTAVTLKWTAVTDNHVGEVSDAWADLTVNGLPEDVQEEARRAAEARVDGRPSADGYHPDAAEETHTA